MSGSNFLVDTNIIIEIFGGNKEIADKLNALDEFRISAVTLGELYVGVNRVSNKTKHLNKVTSFLTLCAIVNIDQDTSQHFGEIVASLYKKGKPIPSNDVWIAASAKQNNLVLITRDKHFEEIEGLSVEMW